MDREMRPASRYHLLTNPVAEYLETRPSGALDDTASCRPKSEFVPDMDRFVPRGLHYIEDYHEASRVQMQEFEITLQKFHEHLQKRKDSVQLKNPREYTFNDVIEIATKLQEDHEKAGQVKSCMGLIRKMFRRAGEKSSVLENLLSFVPSDAYGSVICGGFTMILTAAQRNHELREEICGAISEIPKKLGHIHRQLRVHYASPNLRTFADGILVATFAILEKIVGELTKSLTKKVFMATIKGSDYGEDIKEAIKTLSTRVEEFDSEARICDSERLGQVHETGVRTGIAVEKHLQQIHQDSEARSEKVRFLESQAIKDNQDSEDTTSGLKQSVVHEGLQISVSNAYYIFLMAHPNIDNRTGKPTGSLDNFGFRTLQPSSMKLEPQPNYIDLWLRELAQPCSDSSYIDKCLENVWDLSLKEMDRIKYIMESEELRAWLRSSRSTMLVIDPETRPDAVFNALTSSIAIVTHTLISEAKFPVLSFFCGLHANDVYDEKCSGPTGMVNCLNAQLMNYFQGLDLDTGLSEQLSNPKFRRRSQTRSCKSLSLFENLLKGLPDEDPVIVVVDSACRLLGPSVLVDDSIGGLLHVAAESKKAVKLLITSPLLTDEHRMNTFTELFIPDYIDGDREGLNMGLVQQDAAEAARASQARAKDSDDFNLTSHSSSDSDSD